MFYGDFETIHVVPMLVIKLLRIKTPSCLLLPQFTTLTHNCCFIYDSAAGSGILSQVLNDAMYI